MRDVHAGRAEADARHRGGEHHRAARLDVVGVGHRAAQEPAAVLERLRRPHVRDRIRALVGRPLVRRRRPRALVVRTREVRLRGVADDVEAGRRGHLGPERPRQLGVHDRLRGTQVAVRDPRLELQLRDVEHRHRRGLRAGARRRRDRQVRLERRGRLAALADRRVDVVHHRRRVRDDQVGDLGGVDRGAAADGDEPVHARVAGERRGLLERRERRLDARAVVHDHLDPGRDDRGAHALGMPGGGDARIRDEQRAPHAEPRQLPAGVVRRARPELHRRRLEREDRLAPAHASRSSAARSGAGNGTGLRVARSTNTCTNHPVAAGSSSPALKTASS